MIRRETFPTAQATWQQLWSIEGAVHSLERPAHSKDEIIHVGNGLGEEFELGYLEQDGLWLPILRVCGKETYGGWQSFVYLNDETIEHVPADDEKRLKAGRAIATTLKYLKLMKLQIDGPTAKTVIEVIPDGRRRGYAI